MKKIAAIFCLIFASMHHTSAQIQNNKNWLKPKPNAFLLDTSFAKFYKLTLNNTPNFTKPSSIILLPLDGMPCLVAHTATISQIPNALENYTPTYIPNALPKKDLDIK
ncbi:MAG: hypothetical protein IPP48_12280 [Chitinophagaceae bacterium]|nr:hypothetical protein [Chitinophagaceae bacterium]